MSGSEYLLVVVWLWIFAGPVLSSEPGLQDCMERINLSEITNNSLVFVSPNGTVCFECGFTLVGYLYSINGTEIISNSTFLAILETDSGFIRRTELLVVFDAGKYFSYYSPTSVKCNDSIPNHGGNIYLTRVLLQDLNPPLVEKESTTITEGSTVNLICDGSNSIPQPSLKWISPNGTVISETGHVEIVDITENESGIYTCIATLPLSDSTTYSTVVVQLTPSCKDLSSTDSIIVNITSAAVGSTAIYQCRAKLYSTQCTSQRVWDPDPLASLNCPETAEYMVEQTSDGMARPYRVGVIVLSVIVLVQTLLLVGTTAKIILLVKKKGEEKTKEEKLEMNTNEAYAVPKHVIAHSAVR